jgi:hypothetical protein
MRPYGLRVLLAFCISCWGHRTAGAPQGGRPTAQEVLHTRNIWHPGSAGQRTSVLTRVLSQQCKAWLDPAGHPLQLRMGSAVQRNGASATADGRACGYGCAAHFNQHPAIHHRYRAHHDGFSPATPRASPNGAPPVHQPPLAGLAACSGAIRPGLRLTEPLPPPAPGGT